MPVNYHLVAQGDELPDVEKEAEYLLGNFEKVLPDVAKHLEGKAVLLPVDAPPREWLLQAMEMMQRDLIRLEDLIIRYRSYLSER